jgi:serine/threonine protein kinase
MTLETSRDALPHESAAVVDERFGYRIGPALSTDRWGNVTYEARAADDRPVALKVLGPRGTIGSARRFERAAKARAAVRHAHIRPLLDWGKLGDVSGWGHRQGDRHYVVTDLCRAPTLADLIEAGPMKVAVCLRLLAQLADALEAAHESGLVHHDLTPSNVHVEPRDGGHVWLDDFGLGAAARRETTTESPESGYLPPEAVRGEPLTPSSNVYSLACILVACLSGEPPGPRARRAESEPEPPAAIAEVVAAGMATDPRKRIASPRRFVRMAAEALGSPSPPTGRPIPDPPVSARPAYPLDTAATRARYAFALAVLYVVAIAGASGFLAGHDSDDAGSASNQQAARTPARQATALRATAATVRRLDVRRAAARQRLARANTAPAQAAAAATLQREYAAAARAVRRVPAQGKQLEPALTRAGRAYGRLSAAARRGDGAAYRAAARSVRRSERRARIAVAELNGAGG